MVDITDKAQDAMSAQLERLTAQRAAIKPASIPNCLSCGDTIPVARRAALPGVTLCISCATKKERGEKLYV